MPQYQYQFINYARKENVLFWKKMELFFDIWYAKKRYQLIE
jgi:hypothetical protein